MTPSGRILVVTLPGADGNAVNHLIDADRLPHFERCIERGATAPLDWSNLAAYTGDMLTLMTGVLPHEHGAVAASAPRPDGYGPGPLDRFHLRATPLWEQWAAHGRSVAAINWPATLGTTNTQARVVADRVFQIEGLDLDPIQWPVFPQSVHPASEINAIKTLRVHPAQLEQRLAASPLGAALPEPITPPGSNAAIAISRLVSQLAIGVHYLTQDNDAVVINLDILERMGLPTSKQEADRVLNYYVLLDAALGELLEAASADHAIALIMRPPSAALQQMGSTMTGNGQAVFVSAAHTPDSLLQPVIPTKIAPTLCKMMGMSWDNHTDTAGEIYPITVVEEDKDLQHRLAQERSAPSAILNSTRAAHLQSHIVMEVEHIRSLTKDKGTDAALGLLENRPSRFEELEVLYLNIAEQLIRDARPQDARAFLDRPLEDKQALAWQHFLRANIFLLNQNIAGANQQLKIANNLDPANQQIAALMENLSKLKA